MARNGRFTMLLPSEYLKPRIDAFSRASIEAQGRAAKMIWRIMPVYFLVFLPTIAMELPFWGNNTVPPADDFQYQFFIVTAFWLLLLKKAQLDSWMFAQICRAFDR
jgi:peptidoglycan/LPS O-acetylase OafA/YrhL